MRKSGHLDGAAALFTGLDVDRAYRAVGEGRELGAEALNTRLRRRAHVIAMDGMYAGFAGAKAGLEALARKRIVGC